MKITIIRRKTILKVAFLLLILLIAVLGYLFMNGIIWFNSPSHKAFPVRGVDVSHYQGDIDWVTLSEQDVDFAFIKATEGSSHLDKRFAINWEEAYNTNIIIGAYHFFSFESSGLTQAENFIKNVPIVMNTLPPVVDIEFYGNFSQSPPNAIEVRKELDDMINKLENHYRKKVIIYTTQTVYNQYINGFYDNNPIWIRNVYTRPRLRDNRNWTFWQYSDHGRLDGYNGIEQFIDLNVFNGSYEDFLKLCNEQ